MNPIKRLLNRFRGLADAIARYPLTSIFLSLAAIVNAVDISSEKDYSKLLLTFVVGAFISAVLQITYERFFLRQSSRLLLISAASVLTAGYYLIIKPAPQLSMEINIRTSVALFALLIAFIWVPVIKNRVTFNKSFMIAFKSFFHSLFFSGILFAGISIIITAIDQLIFQLEYTAYSHSANIVFILFAPMFFLSLIPVYPGAANTEENMEDQEKIINKAAHCPKFLEVLLSYIIIPLIAVFTVIMLTYILKNITGEFWTDNLLEPMLVSYSITVIVVYILVSEIENKFTLWFRRIFPKVLVPIVLFQIVASIMSVSETGIMHTRYYVILFGIFAAAAGILLSFINVRRNGIIAPILIICAVISIVPPVDAFTISRSSQVSLLEEVLLKNNMLENNKVKPNAAISDQDKEVVTKAMNYLLMMNYQKDVEWLSKDYNYDDFYPTFGFYEYYEPGDNKEMYLALSLQEKSTVDIAGYDSFIQYHLIMENDNNEKIADFVKEGKNYSLITKGNNDQVDMILTGENNEELLSIEANEIFKKFYGYQSSKYTITPEEATFSKENDKAKMTFVVQQVNIQKDHEEYNSAVLFIFVKIK
ncbi:DUF4153 domain-containing protein [Niallia oryzisoli]|uniref:DUF4153 domain-containing protein n=1 Tax=Niallia oryzisoli TaxID=1737571 RepID=A0ABZ2CDP5_9BACI